MLYRLKGWGVFVLTKTNEHPEFLGDSRTVVPRPPPEIPPELSHTIMAAPGTPTHLSVSQGGMENSQMDALGLNPRRQDVAAQNSTGDNGWHHPTWKPYVRFPSNP